LGPGARGGRGQVRVQSGPPSSDMPSMKNSTRLLLTLGVVLALGLSATPSIAQAADPVPAALAPPGAGAAVVEREAYWRARADAARKHVEAAREDLQGANGDISRMRRRNHPRGEPRAALFGVRDAARIEFDRALDYLEVELPEELERAGALRLWLRE
jgi:hypothetical protein